MSRSMKVRSEPRSGKGVCSDCAHLWVMETETHSQDQIFCAWTSSRLIPITRPISACTKHETINDGTYSGFDAWQINHLPDAVEIRKGYEIRFINSHYEKYDHSEDKWVPVETTKGDL